MIINNEYVYRNVSVTTGKISGMPGRPADGIAAGKKILPEDSEFARLLNEQMAEIKQNDANVQFSKHAVERIYERNIDLYDNDILDRLNKGVELALEKGSSDALIMVDQNAFVVSVENNKVITTMTSADLSEGSIFTNIDSTVFM